MHRNTLYAWCQRDEVPHEWHGMRIYFDPVLLKAWWEKRRPR